MTGFGAGTGFGVSPLESAGDGFTRPDGEVGVAATTASGVVSCSSGAVTAGGDVRVPNGLGEDGVVDDTPKGLAAGAWDTSVGGDVGAGGAGEVAYGFTAGLCGASVPHPEMIVPNPAITQKAMV